MTYLTQTQQLTLEPGQAGAEVAVNAALVALDTFIFPTVASQETAPPGSPAEGDRHLVIATATGAFATHENDIALRWGGAWTFYTPQAGWRVKDLETGQEFEFDGTDWVPQPGLIIPFVTALIAWSNLPSTPLGEWRAGSSQRWHGDLRGKKRIRFSTLCMGLDGSTGSKIAVQYSDDDGANWYYCDSDGANTGPLIMVDGSVAAAGAVLDGAWVNLDAAAKIAGVWLRVVGLGGDDATDPQFGRIDIEIQ